MFSLHITKSLKEDSTDSAADFSELIAGAVNLKRLEVGYIRRHILVSLRNSVTRSFHGLGHFRARIKQDDLRLLCSLLRNIPQLCINLKGHSFNFLEPICELSRLEILDVKFSTPGSVLDGGHLLSLAKQRPNLVTITIGNKFGTRPTAHEVSDSTIEEFAKLLPNL